MCYRSGGSQTAHPLYYGYCPIFPCISTTFHRSMLYRLTQQRLIAVYKDVTPCPLKHLDLLLEECHASLQSAGDMLLGCSVIGWFYQLLSTLWPTAQPTQQQQRSAAYSKPTRRSSRACACCACCVRSSTVLTHGASTYSWLPYSQHHYKQHYTHQLLSQTTGLGRS